MTRHATVFALTNLLRRQMNVESARATTNLTIFKDKKWHTLRAANDWLYQCIYGIIDAILFNGVVSFCFIYYADNTYGIGVKELDSGYVLRNRESPAQFGWISCAKYNGNHGKNVPDPAVYTYAFPDRRPVATIDERGNPKIEFRSPLRALADVMELRSVIVEREHFTMRANNTTRIGIVAPTPAAAQTPIAGTTLPNPSGDAGREKPKEEPCVKRLRVDQNGGASDPRMPHVYEMPPGHATTISAPIEPKNTVQLFNYVNEVVYTTLIGSVDVMKKDARGARSMSNTMVLANGMRRLAVDAIETFVANAKKEMMEGGVMLIDEDGSDYDRHLNQIEHPTEITDPQTVEYDRERRVQALEKELSEKMLASAHEYSAKFPIGKPEPSPNDALIELEHQFGTAREQAERIIDDADAKERGVSNERDAVNEPGRVFQINWEEPVQMLPDFIEVLTKAIKNVAEAGIPKFMDLITNPLGLGRITPEMVASMQEAGEGSGAASPDPTSDTEV